MFTFFNQYSLILLAPSLPIVAGFILLNDTKHKEIHQRVRALLK
jgi:hypothetical protein